jgi:hypothetical protein
MHFYSLQAPHDPRVVVLIGEKVSQLYPDIALAAACGHYPPLLPPAFMNLPALVIAIESTPGLGTHPNISATN